MLEFVPSFEVTVVKSLINFSSRDVEDRMACGVVPFVSVSVGVVLFLPPKIVDVGSRKVLELIPLFEVSAVELLTDISGRDVPCDVVSLVLISVGEDSMICCVVSVVSRFLIPSGVEPPLPLIIVIVGIEVALELLL